MEIKIYRHKTYKDIYLIRNWNICGGGENTDFYKTTHSLREAIDNMFCYNIETGRDELTNDFMYWNERFGNKLKAKVILKKEMNFDGYTGELKKELNLPIDEFELITLVEKV